MSRTNGSPDGDIREVPDTFKLADWPQNAWYAAAYDVELQARAARAHGRRPALVLYRRTDGKAVALENACWHRLLPLSEGKLDGDEVVCGYHGLVYNADGRCTFMPSQETINPAACVRAIPVVEKHRFVWVWTGRSGAGRPGAGSRPALERRPGLGRRRQADPRGVRLQAGGRQPDGPDARDLRARRPASATARWPRRRSRPPTGPTRRRSRAG